MALEPNSLITYTDLNTMGFAPKAARPSGSNQNQTKGRIEDFYRVETGAQPWATYPTDRLPTRATALDVHLGCVQAYDYFYGYAYGECTSPGSSGQYDELRQVIFFFTDGNGNVQSREQIAGAIAAGMPAPPPLPVTYIVSGYEIDPPNVYTQTFTWGTQSYPYAFTYYSRRYIADPYDQQCRGYQEEAWTEVQAPYSYCGTVFADTIPATTLMNPALQKAWDTDLQGQSDVVVYPSSGSSAIGSFRSPHRQNGANTWFSIPPGLEVRNVRIYNIAGQLLYDANGITWIQGNFGQTGGYPNFGGFCGLADGTYPITYSVRINSTSIQVQNTSTQIVKADIDEYCSPDLGFGGDVASVTFTNQTGSCLEVRWYGRLSGSQLGFRAYTLVPGGEITRSIAKDPTGAVMYYAPSGVQVVLNGDTNTWGVQLDSEICYFGVYVWVTGAGRFRYTDCSGNTVYTDSLPTGLNFLPVCLRWGTFTVANVPIFPIGAFSSFGYTSWCPSDCLA